MFKFSTLAFAATIVSSIVDKESPWATIANLVREIRHLPIACESVDSVCRELRVPRD